MAEQLRRRWTTRWRRSSGCPGSISRTSSSTTSFWRSRADRSVSDRERRHRTQCGPSVSRSPISPSHVIESQVPYSTALHATLDGGRHLTGPLARFALNSSALSPIAAAGRRRRRAHRPNAEIPSAASLSVASKSSTRSRRRCESSPTISVRLARSSTFPARAGVGHGVSEAPRGLLYHRYEIGEDGLVVRGDDHSADVAEPGGDRSRPRRASFLITWHSTTRR